MKNDLLSVLIVFALIATEARPSDESVPSELEKLRASYEMEIKRVTEVPKRKYLEALEKLQQFYTRSQDLDKALIVRNEIQILNKESESNALGGMGLEGSEWVWGTGGTLTLSENGFAKHSSWQNPGIWKKVNEVTITVQRPGGDPPMTVVFSNTTLTDAVVTSHLGTKTTIRRIVK